MFFTPSLSVDLLLLAIMLLILGHAWSVFKKGRWFVFDPLNFFWVGAFVIYIKQPISYYQSLKLWYGNEGITETLLWVLFGVFFVIIGYEANWGKRWGMKIPKMPRRLSPNGLLIVAIVIIAAGLFGWKAIFDSAGGLNAWSSESRGKADWENLSGFTSALAALVPVGVTLFVLHGEMHRASPIFRVFAWILQLSVLLWMFYLGSRYRVIFVVVAVFMVWYLPRRKNPPLLLLVPVFIALMIVTSFQEHYRSYFYDFSFHFDRVDWSDVAATVLPSFETAHPKAKVSKGMEFSCTASVVKLVPKHVDYNYGYSELEFFTRPIPRGWWPEKRYPHFEAFTPIYHKGDLSKHWVTYVYRPFLGGPSFGYIGHWYAVGGPFMLIAAGLFTGGLLRAIRSIYDRSGGSEGDIIIYMILSPVGFNDVTGVPLWWIFDFTLTLIPLLIAVNLVKRKKRPQSIINHSYGLSETRNAFTDR
jgi:hypothetical protein